MKDIIFINSHPIQYFAPMYKYMNEQGIKTKAWYCSDESVKGGFDNQFGTQVKWDIPLLDGYEYRFFKNHSPKPSHFTGFFGLMNFGMIKALFQIPKSVIVVHGWHYFTHFAILMLAKFAGHTVCVRSESPYKQEAKKKGGKQTIKRFYLKRILFPRIHYFLYIGTQNKLFYKDYNLPDKELVFCPYSVDNRRFRKENDTLKIQREDIRSGLGIASADKIILYTGKYIDKKKPLDLLRAYQQLNHSSVWLILVGEGELRSEMERFIDEHDLSKVILTGFVNQSKIAEYYSISDVFVMCSVSGETWGLSVNEALNFGLPVVVSDLTGCSEDLVKNGQNGFIFTASNTGDLKNKIEQTWMIHKTSAAAVSLSTADIFSYHTVAKNLSSIL